MNAIGPQAARRLPRVRARRAIASSVEIVALVVISVALAQAVSGLPAANLDYAVAIGDGVHPVTSNGRVAAIARHYLDEQTPELVSQGVHVPPQILGMTVTFARSARELEAGVPEAAVAAAPDCVVWVVRASGDFLNLHDLPWSSSAAPPYQGGRLVIDDATGTILGVYPHAPGE